jgi:MerR family transcriptional regulator, light-induced transcriptional regulator
MAQAASQVYHPVTLDSDKIALKLFDRYWKKFPERFRDSSATRKAQMLEDFRHHVLSLQESLATGDAAILIDHAGWALVRNSARGLPRDALTSGLELLGDVLHEELSPDLIRKSDDYIAKSIAFLATAPTELPSFLAGNDPSGVVAGMYLDALRSGDRDLARSIISDHIRMGIAERDIYHRVLEPVLHEAGRLWQVQKISIAQEHFITGTIQLELAWLTEQYRAGNRDVKRRGKTLVAASVAEELHEIGIRMVADFFGMDGWDTYYIGANTPAPGLITAVREQKADVVALSATMAWHLPRVDYLVRSLRGDPETRHVKIIVGGYPFNLVPDLWQKIGADACAGNAEGAVAAANRLTAKTAGPA